MAGLPNDVTVHLSARLSDAQRSEVEKALKNAGLLSGAKFVTYSID